MNFCKESDKYISLYVDNLLEPKEKEELMSHIEQCSECEQKLKETSLITDFCRQSDDIQLPGDFSSSLHKRLVELSVQEKSNKNKLFIYNKKWVASLSTAAILVISLLVYNLLPHTNFSKSTSSEDQNIAMESSSSMESSNGSLYDSQAKSSSAPLAEDSSSADSSARAGTDLQSDTAQKTFGKQPNTQNAEEENGESSARKFGDSTALPKVGSIQNNETAFSIMAVGAQYFENSAELNLNITTKRIEIDALKKLMRDMGAEEPTVSVSENNEINYFNYYFPLNNYYEMVVKAADIYHLKLTPVTDIVKNDVTQLYNDLNIQKNDTEQKIEAARAKGEDTTLLETDRNRILQKINDIIVKNDMISVRIFIYR